MAAVTAAVREGATYVEFTSFGWGWWLPFNHLVSSLPDGIGEEIHATLNWRVRPDQPIVSVDAYLQRLGGVHYILSVG